MRPLATRYCGRFAPSPSGPLHFGSLIAAVGSYLDAKAIDGEWLVRIEDIDPPRQVTGADTQILNALEAFGLHWDQSVLYQSTHQQDFLDRIHQLVADQHAYACDCTRKRVKSIGGHYDGHCRDRHLPIEGHAVRFKHHHRVDHFHDLRLGSIELHPPWNQEDFIIKRRDGLIAYQLAVVMDDLSQGVNHVVRGIDLLETTGWQIALYQNFEQQPPAYLHLPLALDEHGNKLSKQNHAAPINWQHPQPELCQALACLNLHVPQQLRHSTVSDILDWAKTHWNREKLGVKRSVNL
ncbi:tRNA glutamyl-Q(34) synthetase GluQRS [Echinimonas agarilytica]|uniref:Glutamyl-Q tRNA(Asp) synthetase n=2 Tax=Echinimonas agarilytica TaxID=1215918 RepID=A0AA42B6G1_9GAMM|nr:tRNA glutamyl-Q(34) synthetase GluQRS [Echinimonas agarilytica]MCM2678760.1 tRNA glutamyl-Q(34) synthetase GluQRS [Echinimonas agarilytica]